MAAKYTKLNDAMAAEDNLAEAEIRYRLLAETFEEMPQLRGNLNGALERAKTEIIQLRAARDAHAKKAKKPDPEVVVPFDADRFRKTSGT
ncbi:hypothetical protein GR168_02680 [Gordonia sp. JH63]|uniref:hypothetical protein n=1 Tax=Gordonia sp. JH63 TaxID=2698900 RepID=UPI0013202A12|nr:hypothetical protein [Gordonia sp. JH63]QHD84418.1 hypothetical protein GR168_02680 [Gordonia sp. JH63]